MTKQQQNTGTQTTGTPAPTPFSGSPDPLSGPPAPDFSEYDRGKHFTYQHKKYTVAIALGRGFFGQTFQCKSESPPGTAHDPAALNSVVLKTELGEPHGSKKTYTRGKSFRTEAQWNQTIYGFGVFSGNAHVEERPHHILMLFFKGTTLAKISPQTIQELIHIYLAVLTAFDKLMHAKEIVHGDVKQGNVIYNSQLKECFPIDFGCTHLVGEPTGKYYRDPGQNLQHIAPELFGKTEVPATVAQDVYGLGYLLVQMVDAFLNNSTISNNERMIISWAIQQMRLEKHLQRQPLSQVKDYLYNNIIASVPYALTPIVVQLHQHADPVAATTKHANPVDANPAEEQKDGARPLM